MSEDFCGRVAFLAKFYVTPSHVNTLKNVLTT